MQSTTLLEQAGLKKTRHRLAVLDALDVASEPVTIETLSDSLNDTIDTSTLYRILKQLVEHNIVYQTSFRSSKAYFELQRSHHHHITCTICGVQEEIRTCIADPLSHTFANITSHIIEFFGTCKTCHTR